MATYRVPVLKDFSWQPPVIDKDLTDPPGGEAKGDRYIVASAGAGGVWTGLENHIVTYDGAAWLDDTPTEGWTVWVLDEDCYYHYTGAGAWDKDDVDQMASAILSIEVLASDTLESLHTYESALSDETSVVKSSYLSDLASAISNIGSIADVATASLATALASVESTLSSVIASVETALSDATSEVKASAAADFATNSNLISAVSNAASAISNLAQSNALSITSLIADISAVSNLAQSNYDSINTMHSSLQAYESALSNETSAVKASAAADFATNSNLISNISNALSAVSDIVAAINVSALSNLAESCQDSINLLYSSLHTYESALSDETSAVSAAAHDEFQTNSNLISNISNALSAVSNLAEGAQTVGSYIAAYGAIEFTI